MYVQAWQPDATRRRRRRRRPGSRNGLPGTRSAWSAAALLAWRIVAEQGLVVSWDGDLSPGTAALYGFSRALDAGLVVLHERLRTVLQLETEAILHEAGHHFTLDVAERYGIAWEPGDERAEGWADAWRRGMEAEASSLASLEREELLARAVGVAERVVGRCARVGPRDGHGL